MPVMASHDTDGIINSTFAFLSKDALNKVQHNVVSNLTHCTYGEGLSLNNLFLFIESLFNIVQPSQVQHDFSSHLVPLVPAMA